MMMMNMMKMMNRGGTVVLIRSNAGRVLVARASSDRSTSTKVTPPPDPDFGTVDPAGSHPVKPTTEKVNILDNDIIKGHEYNPLQEIVTKKANVSQEALDSVFPPLPELEINKKDKKPN